MVIEVFATPEAAQKRSDYIQAILTASPILGSEWNHVSGASLMRVSGKLPPTAAERERRVHGGLEQRPTLNDEGTPLDPRPSE